MGIHDGHREHMRRRFLENGLSGFADHEALELLLYYAIPRRDTNPIAHELMDRFGTLSGVLSAPVELLKQVDGVGESAAVLLRLAPLLAQKARLAEAEREIALNTVDSIGAYLLERFSQERNEAVYQLCLDRKGKLLACKRLGEGSASAVNLDIRKLVENALLSSASSVILAHNHPSGVALPSDDDHTATQQARAALEAIGVQLADHIIVADGDFVSFFDSGYFV
ncbi:DNA repair protein RadC [uncultured Oscillibacter sp.]|uniref:JAB domain-containing protein n=1 Tax=uncultured Oscillibacter sp. TaxID=876091 RepID=UPI0025EB9C64|nr:DNA repair protein RadC [uncultured Oscillibacter sp.]